jgi:hypothetical protein
MKPQLTRDAARSEAVSKLTTRLHFVPRLTTRRDNAAIPPYVVMALSLNKQRDKFAFALTLVFRGIKFNYFFCKD